jgi:hypothetical protein
MGSSDYLPVDEEARRVGTGDALVCVEGEANLGDEIESATQAMVPHAAQYASSVRQYVLEKDRGSCPSFVRWRKGASPQEHRALLDRRRLLAWKDRQEKARQEWEAAEADKDRALRDRLSARSEMTTAALERSTGLLRNIAYTQLGLTAATAAGAIAVVALIVLDRL